MYQSIVPKTFQIRTNKIRISLFIISEYLEMSIGESASQRTLARSAEAAAFDLLPRMNRITCIVPLHRISPTSHSIEHKERTLELRYILCVLPPLAVIISAEDRTTWIVNSVLTLLFYYPGVIHAMLIVNEYYADQRTKNTETAFPRSEGNARGHTNQDANADSDGDASL